MKAWIAIQWRVVQVKRLLSLMLLFAGFSLVACAGERVNGDMTRGRQLFTSLPCSGCHGALAQGGFGPALAGTNLTFPEVQRQVRSPRDQMPAFDHSEVSKRDLQDIYSWLTSLPAATATAPVTLPPPEATAAARARFYPAFDPASILAQMDNLDEMEGFNPDAGDWFWVKAKPDGSQIDAEGAVDGCIGCHSQAGNEDYVLRYGFGSEPAVISIEEEPQS